MKLYERTRRVLADEGVAGLLRRAVRKALAAPVPSPADCDIEGLMAQVPRLKQEYNQQVADFQAGVARLGLGDVSRYYWYHAIDLGNGIVTPGDHDYRQDLADFDFPADMRGMKVLDVGSATGFFAFEFEKRGAEVVSVELPSLAAWDMPPGEAATTINGLLEWHHARNLDELHHLHLEAPFQFCHRALKSRVRRVHSSVYELSAKVLDCDGFDLVFMGDVLPHLMAPLKALAALAPLCRGSLMVTTQLAEETNPTPLLLYIGGDSAAGDCRSWSLPNLSCLRQVLSRLGFHDTRVVGHYAGITRRAWGPYHRAVVKATKAPTKASRT